MIAQPYIGITGITSDEDVDTISECCKIVAATVRTHRVMAGVLVSAKTLRGEPTTNRRYPTIDRVEALLLNSRYAYAWPVVHYNTRAVGDSLGNELRELVNRCPSMRGLQLNVVSPEPDVVAKFAVDHPNVEVILQVNRAAMPSLDKIVGSDGDKLIARRNVASEVIAYTSQYEGIMHVLLDASGGDGRGLDTRAIGTIIGRRAHELNRRGIRIGFAGGLGPECSGTIIETRNHAMLQAWDRFVVCGGEQSIDASLYELTALSFDSETRVRVPVEDPFVGEKYQDRLDRDKAFAYIADACVAIRSTP